MHLDYSKFSIERNFPLESRGSHHSFTGHCQQQQKEKKRAERNFNPSDHKALYIRKASQKGTGHIKTLSPMSTILWPRSIPLHWASHLSTFKKEKKRIAIQASFPPPRNELNRFLSYVLAMILWSSDNQTWIMSVRSAQVRQRRSKMWFAIIIGALIIMK